MDNGTHMRIINLSDAAARAMVAGNHGLADKLTLEAEKLLNPITGQTFEEWAGARNLNTEQYQDQYVSKHTAELAECWQAARA